MSNIKYMIYKGTKGFMGRFVKPDGANSELYGPVDHKITMRNLLRAERDKEIEKDGQGKQKKSPR